MKKLIFLSLTILSILGYVLEGLLLVLSFTEESPGMIMIYLIPLLFFGLLFGTSALLLKKVKEIELSQFSSLLHYLNLTLIVLGAAALVYAFNN